MVLQALQFFLGLALRGSCQIGLNRVCKPQVGEESCPVRPSPPGLGDDMPTRSLFAFAPFRNNLRHLFESLIRAPEHTVRRILPVEVQVE